LTIQLTFNTHVPFTSPHRPYTLRFSNAGYGTALDGELLLELPDGVSVTDAGGGTATGSTITFAVGSIGQVDSTAPPASASHVAELAFAGAGQYTLQGQLSYRVGMTDLVAGPVTLEVEVGDFPDGSGGGAGAGAGAAGSSSDADGGCGCGLRPRFAAGAWLLLALGLGLGLRRTRRGRSGAREESC
ncbi:MAG: hypothetical protein JRI55_39860, partial [Deltaproteobacteria bacterium]|nr:hypothetical protein [Deltaproteobacteria bacterium]